MSNTSISRRNRILTIVLYTVGLCSTILFVLSILSAVRTFQRKVHVLTLPGQETESGKLILCPNDVLRLRKTMSRMYYFIELEDILVAEVWLLAASMTFFALRLQSKLNPTSVGDLEQGSDENKVEVVVKKLKKSDVDENSG